MMGYAPMFLKSSVQVVNGLTLFGVPIGGVTTTEEWCGFFGGSCLAQSLDNNGDPVVPTQLEPALCGMTKAICGKEADMKAAMDFKALGGATIGPMPCLP